MQAIILHGLLEQLYGYMVRNGKSYDVLTTMKGWCLLYRENGRRLYVTEMFEDYHLWQGLSDCAAEEVDHQLYQHASIVLSFIAL